MPLSLSSCAVPPVERICTPCVSSARAKSTMPDLSETDRRARWIFTSIQSVLLELLAEGIAVEPEQLRRARLVALGLVHDHFQHGLLDRVHHHLVDAGAFLPVEVLEVLAHHLADGERQLVLPGGLRP